MKEDRDPKVRWAVVRNIFDGTICHEILEEISIRVPSVEHIFWQYVLNTCC